MICDVALGAGAASAIGGLDMDFELQDGPDSDMEDEMEAPGRRLRPEMFGLRGPDRHM